MADELATGSTQVEELKLDIKVTENGSATNIDKVTQSIKNLYNTIKLIAKPLSAFSHQMKNIGVTGAIKDVMPKTGKMPKVTTTEVSSETGIASDIPQAVGEAEKYKQTISDLIEKVKSLQDQIKDFGEKAPKDTKKAEKGFKKFYNALKRVAFYRIVRAVLKNVAQAFQEGIQNLAKFSKEANDTMSKLASSTMLLKNALATGLMPLLNAATPLIVGLADAVSAFANNISLLSAKWKGDEFYTKAIKNTEDYIKSQKEAQKQTLSFDKFESLNGKKETDQFGKVSISTDYMKGLTEVKTALTIVLALAVALALIIGGIPALIALVVASVAGLALLIIHYWDNIKNGLIKFGGWLKTIAQNIGITIGNIFYTIGYGVIAVFTGILNFLIVMINKVIKPLGTLLGKDISINLIKQEKFQLQEMKQFANGGVPQKGTAFIAGEAGAVEAVTNSSSGKTNVTNVTQMEDAFLNALYRYGAMQNGGIDISGKITAVVDGAEIASSTRFRNEANRRNPNLGWA